jgi:hypothetical protein
MNEKKGKARRWWMMKKESQRGRGEGAVLPSEKRRECSGDGVAGAGSGGGALRAASCEPRKTKRQESSCSCSTAILGLVLVPAGSGAGTAILRRLGPYTLKTKEPERTYGYSYHIQVIQPLTVNTQVTQHYRYWYLRLYGATGSYVVLVVWYQY